MARKTQKTFVIKKIKEETSEQERTWEELEPVIDELIREVTLLALEEQGCILKDGELIQKSKKISSSPACTMAGTTQGSLSPASKGKEDLGKSTLPSRPQSIQGHDKIEGRGCQTKSNSPRPAKNGRKGRCHKRPAPRPTMKSSPNGAGHYKKENK